MGLSLRALYQPTVLLAMALMAVIAMMILPMPAWVLDMGLAASFGLAILIFTITLFINRPLDFSAFPTILLASLMLRLSLNVSSTKLIIGQGHTGTKAAGDVIEGFAMFIMGGSVFLGLVVFGVLLIVNFIVITKGAGRMAEVGARFALDGMPGKQLAIDSDMAAGAISHAEARERRRVEQEETTFFGSLDGASKFVKGDAIAGLLITLLNLVMGLAMGVLVHGMPIGDAYKSIYESLSHGGIANDCKVRIRKVRAEDFAEKGSKLLEGVDGLLVPGGFGERGLEGKIEAVQHARESGLPFFGICLGLQVAVIEFARNVCGLRHAHTTESDEHTPDPVIHLMPDQEALDDKGGTMRLGAWPCRVIAGTRAHRLYGTDHISERHRHRYEVNNDYRQRFQQAGLVISGVNPERDLVEMVELPEHPFFIGVQFHPEFKSRPLHPQPLFKGFVAAALEHARARQQAPSTERAKR
jgi:gamma-glutamyl-gamma-aminobutyrate hydrolase PuuD